VAKGASSRQITPCDAEDLVGDKIEYDDVVRISEHEDVGERAIDSNKITFEVRRVRRGRHAVSKNSRAWRSELRGLRSRDEKPGLK
jgi:ribosomal protein L21